MAHVDGSVIPLAVADGSDTGSLQEPTTPFRNSTPSIYSKGFPAKRQPVDGEEERNEAFTEEEEADSSGCCSCVLSSLQKIVPRGGTLSGVFNLASVTLGAGIISIPSAFNTSGMIMAIIYLLVVTVLTVFSINLLMHASQRSGLRSFEAMGRGLFGRGGDIVVACPMLLLCFGGAVGYIIAAGDIISAIFNHDGIPPFLRGSGGRRCLMTAIWLFFMYPLTLPKQVNSLRYASVAGIMFILFFVVCVIVHAVMNGLQGGIRKDLVMVREGNAAISGLSIFMFSYLCQVNVFKIAYEKKRPTPRKSTIEAGISCSICCLLYFLTGFFGYTDFGPALEGNILQYYNPYEFPVFFACFVGLIVKLCAAFSLNMLACRTALFQVLRWDLDTMPYWKHTIISSLFAIGALILGLFVPDINMVFGLVGALCGGFIGFVFPALFVMYTGNWTIKSVGIWYYLATYFLLLCGVIAIVFGTGSSIYGVVIKYS